MTAEEDAKAGSVGTQHDCTGLAKREVIPQRRRVLGSPVPKTRTTRTPGPVQDHADRATGQEQNERGAPPDRRTAAPEAQNTPQVG